MKKHLNVHIYGNCGAPCPGNTEEDCLEYLSSFYTFLLVFETHVCQHYMSPHLLRALHLKTSSIIPVVFGGINYNELFSNAELDSLSTKYRQNKTMAYFKNDSKFHGQSTGNIREGIEDRKSDHERHPMFMIDALGQSPRALAHYLKHLVSNMAAGVKGRVDLSDYLRWKKTYELNLKEWPCLLCEKLRKKRLTQMMLSSAIGRNSYQNKLLSSELCTSWPTLDFSGG